LQNNLFLPLSISTVLSIQNSTALVQQLTTIIYRRNIMALNPRPNPFVVVSANTGSMIVNYLDRQTNQAGLTYGVGYQFLTQGRFEPEEIQRILALLNLRRQYFGDGVVMLDCGANIGAVTIPAGIEMTGWGKVISFEAQERIYYALAGNVAINNCFNVKAIYSAIGNPVGQEYLDIPIIDYTIPSSFGSLELRPNQYNEFIGQQIDYQKTQKVPLVSVDSLELDRVDFIKIDVEGMEVDALKGALNTIEKYKPILTVEFLKSGYEPVAQFLAALGYQLFVYDLNILAVHQNDPCLANINS